MPSTPHVPCASHPSEEAVDFCVDCQSPLCSECAVALGDLPRCVRCYARQARLTRRHRAYGAVVGVMVVVGASAWAWLTHGAAESRKELFGAYAPEILRLEALWERAPCSSATGERLVELLLESGHGAEASRVASHLAHRCPPTLDSFVQLFALQLRLGEAEEAVETANSIVALAPWRPEGYAYRGLAHEASGRLQAAADDFSEALSLAPRLMDVPLNLANVLERQGRFCEAAEPLEEALGFYPGLENRFDIEHRVRRLRRLGGCASEKLDANEVRVPFDRTEEVILVDGAVNGAHKARFILDTGASSVVVSRSLAERLGIEASVKASPVYVQTAGGVVDAYPAELKEVSIAGARVSDLSVLVCDTMGHDVDGLLGNNFLNRFKVAIDHEGGIVSFHPAEAGTQDSDAQRAR